MQARWVWALVLCLFGLGVAKSQNTDWARAVRAAQQLYQGDRGAASPSSTSPEQSSQRDFKLERADSASQDGDNVRLSGNVRFRFRDFDVTCDDAEGNLETEIFTLRGRVKVRGEGLGYQGEKVVVNFKDRTAEFERARTVIEPKLIQGPLKQNIFIQGASGTGSESRYSLADGICTTCELEHPHYHLSAREIEVFPENRMILRDARLEILGATILRVPYLSIPLDETAPRYLPETGQSRDEGYFIKTRFGIGVPGDETLDARVDLMTKLGLGLGTDLRYRDAGRLMSGDLRLYGLVGPRKTLTGSLNHRQQLGSVNLNINADYSRFNYLTSPNNTTLTLRNLATFPLLGGQTRIAYNRLTNQAPNFRTESQNIQLGDNRSWRGGLTTTLDVNLSSVSSRSGTFDQVRRVLDLRASATQRFTSVDAQLAYLRTVPITESANFFSATDQTPLFTLRSDLHRLTGRRSGFNLQTEMSIGEWVDSVRRRSVTRTHFEVVLPQQTFKADRLTMNVAGRFKQSLYSDDTAQFVFGTDAAIGYRLGERVGVNVRHNYLRPQGFSPLTVDRTGRNDLFGADITLKLRDDLTVAAQSGYDLLARDRNFPSSWQSIGSRLEWTPSDKFSLRLSATYDMFNEVWNSLRVESALQIQGAKFNIGARFDGQRSTWGAINIFGEGVRWGRLTTSFLLAYNGYTRQFESRQFSFLYDMHCSEALLEIIDNRTGFRNGTQISFFIRLKALPFATPFGRGTRGQGSGIGTGVNF